MHWICLTEPNHWIHGQNGRKWKCFKGSGYIGPSKNFRGFSRKMDLKKAAFWYFPNNSSLVSGIGDTGNGDIFFRWNFYDKCRYHSVGELLIISALSIHFNTLNLTNVYLKANTTVQNSSDLLRKFFEKTHSITGEIPWFLTKTSHKKLSEILTSWNSFSRPC